MHLAVLWPFAIGTLLVSATTPRKSIWMSKRNTNGPADKFVTTKNGQFSVNGSNFPFVGTNAYWLQTLNVDQDVANTLSNITAAGIKVVRTWAFNDVDTIPENGTWFQVIANGTTAINNGTNGLPKLDALIKHAEDNGIYLMLTLTNNWNPRPLFDNITSAIGNLSATVQARGTLRRDVTPGTNNTLPRNTLSNDYGGMDLYVRQFGLKNHDDFYTNETLIAAFENYTTQVVSRYVNSPAIFAWEIANDPRCNSSLAATPSCNTTTITSWLSRISKHIQSIDPNHLITAGNQGFFCVDCKKLFPRVIPPSQPSPAPGQRRRSIPAPLTKARLFKERTESWKKTRELAKRSAEPGAGVRIRGNWVATPTRRQQDTGVGSAFDGSQGVDSEDIINIPQIGFGTFQLFPDQNSYGPDDPNLDPFNNTVQTGIDWINRQTETSKIFGKPISLTGFGLVTQDNAPAFVPFNTSIAPFAPDNVDNSTGTVQPFGVTDQQRDDAYSQWLGAGIEDGLQGIMQYQWGQGNLTAEAGTTIAPDANSTSQAPNQDQTGVSPNDGYSIQGTGEEGAVGVISQASQQIAPDS